MLPDEDFIDHKYRRQLFDTYAFPPTLVGHGLGTKYRLDCPLCGARRSHLVWMPHKRTWKFVCSTSSRANCQSQLEFPVLLKTWCPELFRSYQQERFDAGTTGPGFNCPRPQAGSRRRRPVDFPRRRICQDQTGVAGISTTAS